MNTKTCYACKKLFPCSSEWFSKDSSHKDGLKSICKSCEIIKNHDRYLKNKKTYKERNKAYYESHKEQSYEQSKRWRANHPEAHKEHNARYQINHRVELLARKAIYRNEHREELNQKSSQYYHSNIETCTEARYRWQKENRDLCSVATQKYRSKKKGLDSTLTKEQWDSTKDTFGNKCAYCGKDQKLEQEHFVSVSNGGTFTKENILPSCRSCNCSKNNKNFYEWYPSFRYYSKERERRIIEYLST